jgi:hypothetical protein
LKLTCHIIKWSEHDPLHIILRFFVFFLVDISSGLMDFSSYSYLVLRCLGQEV